MNRGKAHLPEFPPKPVRKKPTTLQVRFPNEPPSRPDEPDYRGLLGRLGVVAETEGESINSVILFFLSWATDDWERVQARKKKK